MYSSLSTKRASHARSTRPSRVSGIWVPPRRIRVVVIGVIWRGADILAMEITDRLKDQILGYRPPGGEIDFGEASDVALAREMREELDADVAVGDVIAVIENRYDLNGATGHEVVIARAARFLDEGVYATDTFTIIEPAADGGEEFTDRALWVSPTGAAAAALLPRGLEK